MGTIVGSAVFNILCIIGVCGLFAGQVKLAAEHGMGRGRDGVEVRPGPVSLQHTHVGARGLRRSDVGSNAPGGWPSRDWKPRHHDLVSVTMDRGVRGST